MCLAIPGKVVSVFDSEEIRMGKVDFGGIQKTVCLQYTPDVQVGEYVVVHVGFALSKMNEEEAERTYKLLEELNQLSELEVPEFDPETFKKDDHEVS
jgi:hydrogenase expression/formation protein HypC